MKSLVNQFLKVSTNQWPTVLDLYIGCIPPDECHRSDRLCDCFLGIVPGVSISEYSTGFVAVDVNMITRKSNSSVMVLVEYRPTMHQLEKNPVINFLNDSSTYYLYLSNM